jgi:hypothetical protein
VQVKINPDKLSKCIDDWSHDGWNHHGGEKRNGKPPSMDESPSDSAQVIDSM